MFVHHPVMPSPSSFRSLALALAALGYAGLPSAGGGARIAPSATPLPVAADPLTVKRAPDGLFYVTAAVNGVPIRFVVDTGANVVVLTPADAAAAGVAGTADTAESLRTAGGSAAMRWATIDRLTIGGHAIARPDAAIIAADGPPHSLLGQSVLSRLDSVTLRSDRLQLR
jgi:aspartyl protease family protein